MPINTIYRGPEALPLAIERECQIEPRLMIERIGSDFSFELGQRT